MKILFAIFSVVAVSSPMFAANSITGQPCVESAKSAIKGITKINYGGTIPAGFTPSVRGIRMGSANSSIFTIDMRNQSGQILNGSHGGSSAYEIDLTLESGSPGKEICFVNSLKFVDEPELDNQ